MLICILKSANIADGAVVRKIKIRKRIITVFDYPAAVPACCLWLKIACGNRIVPSDNSHCMRNSVTGFSFRVVIIRFAGIVIRTGYGAVLCNCLLYFVYSV